MKQTKKLTTIKVEHDIIKFVGQGLAISETTTIICPFCENDWQDQGKPKAWAPEKSCSVTRKESRTLYKCHRATCERGNQGGSIFDFNRTTTGATQIETTRSRGREIRPYTGELVNIPNEIYEEMIFPYEITQVQAIQQNWKWAPKERALCMPIYNNMGRRIGSSLKLSKAARRPGKPHVFSYPEINDEPLVHFPRRPEGRSIVDGQIPTFLVEDQIAATKIACVGQAAAILGTSVSEDSMIAIKSAGVRRIIVYLDPDAWHVSLKLVTKFSGLFEEMRAVRPGKEPKEQLLTFYWMVTKTKYDKPLCSSVPVEEGN